MQTYLLPATARAAGTAGPALGGRRRDALGAQVQRDDAVGFERVGKESGHEAAARGGFDFAVAYARCMLSARPTFSEGPGVCAVAAAAINMSPDTRQAWRVISDLLPSQ